MNDILTNWRGWAAISKVDEEQRIVYGIASSEAPDDQPGIYKGEQYAGDIVSSAAMKAASPDYLQYGNVREMHGNSAAGTVVHFDIRGPDTQIAAHIVDDQAWAKVVNKVYKGFSIGGRMIDAELTKIDGTTYRKITKLKLTEISLVDRPANSAARITLYKGADMTDEEQIAGGASDDLTKAADPSKAIALLQALRNDAENDGDTDAADAYTDAIRQVLVASGVAQSGADADADTDDTGDESGLATDDGSDPGTDVAMSATVADLAKAGAVLSSTNHALARTAHDALQKMTGGAVCQPKQQADGLAMADGLTGQDLAKAIQPAFDGIAKVLEANGVQIADLAKRMDHLESQPAPGAPAARVVVVEKSLPGGDIQPPAANLEEVELTALRKVRDNATDDITRRALADEITRREIRNVYRPVVS